MARALALQARGQGFDSLILHKINNLKICRCNNLKIFKKKTKNVLYISSLAVEAGKTFGCLTTQF